MKKEKLAFVVIDMQNAFCSERGSFILRGHTLLDIEKVLANINKVLKKAHERKAPVVLTRLVFKKGYCEGGLLVKRNPQIKKIKAYLDGTKDSLIDIRLHIDKTDMIIEKSRFDPFVCTEIEKILKRKKIDKLLVAGVLTNVCVESFVRSAFDRGFEPFVLKDATTTTNKEIKKFALKTMEAHFANIITAKQAILMLDK